jgi:adenylate cyclase, class 2
MILIMKTEIEAKFLDVNLEEMRKKLKALGATLVYSEALVRQKVFDYPDFRLDKDSSWLRLRQENEKVILTLKKWEKEGIHGMKEIETKVESFEETERLLRAIGMIIKSTQEKKRELWKLDDVEFMIDTWPWVPTFIEIEGNSEEKVKEAAAKLSFNWKDAHFGGAARIYKRYFDIEYEQIDKCPEVLFSSVPEWLDKVRIKR